MHHYLVRLQEKATKWYTNGEIDGLTTNGVLIMHPAGGYGKECRSGVWREVSVGGGIYALRESRSTPQKSSLVSVGEGVGAAVGFFVFRNLNITIYTLR